MHAKPIQLVLIIIGLYACRAYTGEIETRLNETNPEWQITSEAFTNPPYWLIPTNVQFRIIPLKNGQWVWTTNADAHWHGEIGIEMDDAKERAVRQQWKKEHEQMNDANDPPGIANVYGYKNRTWFQKRFWNTNALENWQGIWAEDTNTGWRVNLRSASNNVGFEGFIIKVGSLVTNSGAGLLPTPDCKYAKLQLLDSNGKAVPPRRGAAMKLYEQQYTVVPESAKRGSGLMFVDNQHPPTASDASVERDYPDTISDMEYPRWQYTSGGRNGWFANYAGFVSNGPPCLIGYIKFDDIFSIKTEGDYTFTVQPVLFRQHFEGGTFQGYLDRVNLPSVTTKVHLVPNK